VLKRKCTLKVYSFRVTFATAMENVSYEHSFPRSQRYNETFVKKGRALGELGHPDGPTVNLDRVSHKIVSLT
jgi:hypothetical protein